MARVQWAMKVILLLASVALILGVGPEDGVTHLIEPGECLHVEPGPPPTVEYHLEDCTTRAPTGEHGSASVVVHVL